MGYGESKKRVFELFLDQFGPARNRYEHLQGDTAHVNAVLADGARRAREVARMVMDHVRRATGLTTVETART
jgi:tryptophanyl-tRNA synthetase